MEKQGKQQDAEREQLAKSKSLVKNKLVVAAIALICAVALVTGGYFTYSAYTANGFLKSSPQRAPRRACLRAICSRAI